MCSGPFDFPDFIRLIAPSTSVALTGDIDPNVDSAYGSRWWVNFSAKSVRNISGIYTSADKQNADLLVNVSKVFGILRRFLSAFDKSVQFPTHFQTNTIVY